MTRRQHQASFRSPSVPGRLCRVECTRDIIIATMRRDAARRRSLATVPR